MPATREWWVCSVELDLERRGGAPYGHGRRRCHELERVSSRDWNRSMWIREGGTCSSRSTCVTDSMNGLGPQTNAVLAVYGAARPAAARGSADPCTDSSQWMTCSALAGSRQRADAARRRRSPPSRVGWHRRAPLSRRRSASADFRIDSTGVMPLPPAKSRKSSSSERGVNVPAGGRQSSMSPGRRRR